MSDVSTLDTEVLANYLSAQVDGFRGPLTATKFKGGQSNPTFLIEAASGSYVLRRQPPGKLLKSAHAVDREYRVLAALQDTDVPVARVYHLCEDRSVIGSMFYLMEYCNGTVHWDSQLSAAPDNTARSAMYEEMIRVLAAIHSVDLQSVGLADYGKPGNYFERQYSRWSGQYLASELEPIAEMNQLMDWLAENLPADDGKVALVHGDYRLDNLMFAKDHRRILAVLDWELSTLGHPFADLAYLCMTLRMPAESRTGPLSTGLAGLDVKSLGIPTESELVERYCERMGYSAIGNWSFYLAFSFFRIAAIAQGVAKRAVEGNASSEFAVQIGKMVRPLTIMALDTLE